MKDKFKVELFLEYENNLAESPHYDTRYRLLSWVDIPKGLLITSDTRGKIKTVSFNEKIGCAIPLKRSNGFLVFGTTNLYVYEEGIIKSICDLTKEFDPSNRCNDANIDKMGRIWFSSIVDDGIHSPESKLYCYTNKELVCMDPDLKLGNGICWNAKYTRMFVVDSVAHVIYVYDYDLDTVYISNKRVLCNIYDGTPDGMIIDKDENLWVAIWDGERIEVRSSKTGLLKKTYDVPTSNVTCLCYNKEESSLIITSAKSADRLGGNLFELKTDVKFPDFEYATID
jgi:gluconolactonase